MEQWLATAAKIVYGNINQVTLYLGSAISFSAFSLVMAAKSGQTWAE
jgi:hypothetical protein